MVLIAFIAVSCGLSPFLYGFYDVSVWGPIALGLLAALLGLVIARPAVPRRPALIAAGALAGLWLWALFSIGWAESADQALTEANRWLLYAALFAVLVLLLRDDRLGTLVIGAGAAVILALGAYVAIRMLAGSGEELFLGGRLNEPLGYINGQAGYLLLGIWPLVALAERARNPLLAGGGLAGATFLGSLVLLCQTRAVVPAVLLSALLLVVAVPGRTRRGWALVVAGVGVAACIGPVLDVYDSVRGSRPPQDSELRPPPSPFCSPPGPPACSGPLPPPGSREWATRGAARAPGRLGAAGAGGRRLARGRRRGAGRPSRQGPSRVQRLHAARRRVGRAHRASPPEAATVTTTGAWRPASSPTIRIRGVGAGNFDSTYFLERRTSENIRQPHSLELQTLGELGIVGGLLLAAFLVAIALGFARRAREASSDPRARGLAVAAGGTLVVWLVHTSVDWLHLIPGLTGIALCSAAVLVGPWARSRATRAGKAGVAIVAVCGLVVLVGAVLVGRAALADRYLNEGRDALAIEPAEAIAKANDSQRLNDEAPSGLLPRVGRVGAPRRLRPSARRARPRPRVASRMIPSPGRSSVISLPDEARMRRRLPTTVGPSR